MGNGRSTHGRSGEKGRKAARSPLHRCRQGALKKSAVVTVCPVASRSTSHARDFTSSAPAGEVTITPDLAQI